MSKIELTSTSLFAKTMKELMVQAEKDGKITADEIEIIKQVEVDVESYELILREALDDGVINEAEKKHLNELKELILDRAETIASLDGMIAEDENQLLAKLSEIISRHYNTT